MLKVFHDEMLSRHIGTFSSFERCKRVKAQAWTCL
jgi:hypothetical protein